MSIKVTSWALNDAPVDDPVLVLVLVAMAERANDDGTATYQSVATIARKARVSVRTCQTRLRQLEEAGLIRRGNQDFTAHLKAGSRPVVYDLAVHLNRGAISAPLPVAGVQDGALRGATSGSGGVQRVADESSLNRPSDSSVLFAHEEEVPVVKVKKSSTSVPDKISISAEMKEWALGNAPSVVHSLERETASFLDWHRSRGRKYLDWTAAWRNWMRKAHEFNVRTAGGVAHAPQAQPAHNGRRLNINYDEPDTDDATGYSTSTR